MKRREFLFQLPAGLLLAKSCSLSRPGPTAGLRGEVFVTGVISAAIPRPSFYEVAPDAPGHLIFFTGGGAVRCAPVPFEVHSVMQNPRHRNLALLVPKWGQSLAVFDLVAFEVRQLASVKNENRRFFGHAVWEPSGEHFWVTERDDGARHSVLSRWSRGLQRERSHPTNSDYAHEVQWTPDGQLLVANAGSPRVGPALSWISPATGRVERFIDCTSPDGVRYVSHLYQLPALGKIFGIGKNDQRTNESLLLAVHRADGRVRAIRPPAGAAELFRGESLSIEYDELRRQLAVTSVDRQGYFSLWDPEKEEFVSGIPGTGPRGVLTHRGAVYVTQNRGRSITGIAAGELVRAPFAAGGLDPRKWEWGAHVYRLAL